MPTGYTHGLTWNHRTTNRSTAKGTTMDETVVHPNGITITRAATEADITGLRQLRNAFGHKPWLLSTEAFDPDTRTYRVLFPASWPVAYCMWNAVYQRAALRGLTLVRNSESWNTVFISEARQNPFGYRAGTSAILVTVLVEPNHNYDEQVTWH